MVHGDQLKHWTFSPARAHRSRRASCPEETETNGANANPDENRLIPQIDLVLPGDKGTENMGNEPPVLRKSQRTTKGVLIIKLRDDCVIGSM